jgi:hypothetical protein
LYIFDKLRYKSTISTEEDIDKAFLEIDKQMYQFKAMQKDK